MITVASMIAIVGFSLGIPSQPVTLHIYTQPMTAESRLVEDIPSVVTWREMHRDSNFQPPTYQVDTKFSKPVQTINGELSAAFKIIALPPQQGYEILARAKEILNEAKYPCANIIPVIAHDPEEPASYLTLRLFVNANMNKTFELDSLLTKSLISAFPHLPVNLSFSVYENEGAVA